MFRLLLGIWSGAIFCALILFSFYDWNVIMGPSMKPTLEPENIILIKRNPRHIQRGDIVSFQIKEKDVPYIKRVVAMEGDRVEGRNHQLYVNGRSVQKNVSAFSALVVPKDHVFLMGDNADQSIDSRDFGPVSIQSVSDQAVAIIWPLSKVGLFNSKRAPFEK
ncbi:signal peptidase I [Salinithrix halophila]|uniref:Signal peptidase I n=1 Tax=Salinithrix halophila TaxID=1485204 RepID=A0ABV8JDU1_9BACL